MQTVWVVLHKGQGDPDVAESLHTTEIGAKNEARRRIEKICQSLGAPYDSLWDFFFTEEWEVMGDEEADQSP